MKEHFCPAEQSVIAYEGECNWCGESEGSMKHKALVRRLQISCLGLDRIDPLCLLVDDVIAALAQTKQQELVAYWKEHAQGLQRDYDSLLADFQAQQEERNFCPRCGKRTKDIHTCTPPQENT